MLLLYYARSSHSQVGTVMKCIDTTTRWSGLTNVRLEYMYHLAFVYTMVHIDLAASVPF